MGFDRSLKPVHPDFGLNEAHGALDFADVGDVADLLVVREPVTQLRIERLFGPLADAADAGANGVQCANELTLVLGKTGFEEDDVHGGEAMGFVAQRDEKDRGALRSTDLVTSAPAEAPPSCEC